MSRKTLLMVTSTFPRWSKDTTPSFVFDLATRLTDAYHVIILAPHAKGANQHEVMEGVEVIRYRYFFDWGETLAYNSGIVGNLKNNSFNYLLIPLLLIAQLNSLLTLLRHKKIDIIHAHWSIPNGVCAAMALSFAKVKPKLVCTLHGSDLNLRSNLFKMIHRFVFRKSSHITTVSTALYQQAIVMGAMPDQLSVISMGVDTQKTFTPSMTIESRNKLLFVGRLINSKGVDILLKALATVVTTYPEQHLLIVGDGVERDNLEALTKTLGISNNVTFTGSKSHQALPDYYRQARIFISPTLAEGFGLTIAEAMACECAVIASDVEAVSDLIDDQKTGLLFEVGNVEVLTHSILSLLNNPGLCDALSKEGRQKITNQFDWDCIASNYQKMFSGLQ